MSLKDGPITLKKARAYAEQRGVIYLKNLLSQSAALPLMESRLSSDEQQNINIAISEHESLDALAKEKAKQLELEEEGRRHAEFLAATTRSNEINENLMLAAKEANKIANEALRISARSVEAVETQTKLATTSLGIAGKSQQAAEESAQAARNQVFISCAAALISFVSMCVTIYVVFK